MPGYLAAGLLGAACSSSGGSQQPSPPAGAAGGAVPSAGTAAPVPSPIQGCVPDCNPPGPTRPGKIPGGPYPDDPRDMKKFLARAEDLIATVQIPATSA